VSNLLQTGAAWLGEQLKEVAAVTVAYHRGSSSIAEVTATVSLHEYEVLDTDGIMVLIKSRDYIVHAADLVLSGSTITPRSGDRIVETHDGSHKDHWRSPGDRRYYGRWRRTQSGADAIGAG